MEKSQKGFTVPLLIAIIAALAIGGCVYYIYINGQALSIQPPKINEQTTSRNNVQPVISQIDVGTYSSTSTDFYSIKVTYPGDWQLSTVDVDKGSSLTFNYNTSSEIDIGYGKQICSDGGFSTCFIAEFTYDPKTTIYNGKGDIKYFNALKKYESSQYTFIENGTTKIGTPIVFYKDKKGKIYGLFSSKKDTFDFHFEGGDLSIAKKFLSNIEFK